MHNGLHGFLYLYMKKLITILFYFSIIPLLAQNKYDNIWLINNGLSKNSTIINWNNSKPNMIINKIETGSTVSDPNASICNAEGHFRFASAGCSILGSDYKIIDGGKDINPGFVYDQYCFKGTNYYPAFNNIVFLPNPEDTTRYYLLHTGRSSNNDLVTFPFVWFYYSEIATNSVTNGQVINKNVLLAPRDSMSEIGPLACKHANGKDWWIVVPGLLGDWFYRALLTKNGVSYMGKQKIKSKKILDPRDWAGQGVFTPDGAKYIRTDPFNGTFIYDFDRCTGLMSNQILIDTLIRAACSGTAVSPNSQYLYITYRSVLYQLDLKAPDVYASRIKIADKDTVTTNNGFDYGFYKCQLAPDGKIYIASTNSVDKLGVIHNPDAKGLACDFRQHDLQLPGKVYIGLPNMPHFRTPRKDVVCTDIITTSDVNQKVNTVYVYPNPSKGMLTIESFIIHNQAQWQLYDAQGRLVYTTVLSAYRQQVTLPNFLPQGIYFWKLVVEGNSIEEGKLVLAE